MKYEHSLISKILETAIVAARRAGQHAMEKIDYAKPAVKDDEQLVTQVDLDCQEMIIRKIKETFPDHGFIAEEGDSGKLFKQSPRGSDGFWWVIDPIDGTNNYVHKMLDFCVSVGVIHEGMPIAGAIYVPATDSMFTGAVDVDSQLNNRRIEVSDQKLDRFASVGLDGHFPGKVPGWLNDVILKCRFRNYGSTTLQMAYTASAGLACTATGYPKLWDIAGGAAIVLGAGGKVTDWQGNDVFPVDMENYDGGTLPTAAGNPNAHKELLEMIAKNPN